MQSPALQRVLEFGKPLVYGLLFFVLLIGQGQGFAALNAAVSPALPWFPIPALVIMLLAIRWVRGRTDIRWRHPGGIDWRAAYAFAVLATYAAVCLSVFEGWFHNLDRPAPQWPDPAVSALFQVCFLLTIPLIAAVLAEVAFRGIIQTRFEKLLPLWPMLFVIAVINALMHFYDPDQGRQWLRFVSLNLAFGYVTWRTQSILPALLAHVLMNLFEPLSRWLFEPGPYRELPGEALWLFAASGSLALGVAVLLDRRIGTPQAQSLQRQQRT